MLFSGDESLKATEALSGGEAARLLMAQLMMQKNPILVLSRKEIEAVTNQGDAVLCSGASDEFILSYGAFLPKE